MARKIKSAPMPTQAQRASIARKPAVRAAALEALAPAADRRFAEERARVGEYVPRKNGKLAMYADVFSASDMDRAQARAWAKEAGHSVGSVMQMYKAWAKLMGKE